MQEQHEIPQSLETPSPLKHDFSEEKKSILVGRNNVLSRLDRIDKKLSEPVLKLLLPFWMECLLSVPGNFFGTPTFSTAVAPSLIAWMDTTTRPKWWWCLAVIVAFGVVLMIWARILQGKKGALAFFFGSKAGMASPLIGVLLLARGGCPDPSLGYFQSAAWCAVVIPVALLKPTCQRRRPIVTYNKDFPKHLDRISQYLHHDALHSFPSGDVATSVAFAYPLWRCNVVAQPVAAAIVMSSAFGRLYWQAHHFADVVVGALVAIPSCRILELLIVSSSTEETDECPCREAQWWHPLTAFMTMATIVICARLILKRKVFASGTIQTQSEKKK